MPRPQSLDVLIVGSGIAGLSAALSVRGRHVTVLSADAPERCSSSALAQGGLAAPIGANDSVDLHLQDTLAAGAGANAVDVVASVIGDAAEAIDFLNSLGVMFDRDERGWRLHREGGHSRARILHCRGDSSGAGILRALLIAARSRSNVELRGGMHLLELLQHEGRVCGMTAQAADSSTVVLRANDVVLATGGIGQMFRHTTNPRSACGDGLAAAFRAGASTAALEFVQFHPTALLVARDPLPLITEALRGAGAVLVDERGRRFMVRRHPYAELAPRDVVSRAVWEHIEEGGSVVLDATHLSPQLIESEFPTVYAICRAHGIDPTRTPIPVTPAAHFHMGGVCAALDGRTSLAGLWCCGEVAHTGLHGANRLASNSLLEAVVCGRLTGAALSGSTERGSSRFPMGVPGRPGRPGWAVDQVPAADDAIWMELRDLMWRHAGIVRNAAGLSAAIERVQELRRQLAPEQGVLRRRLLLAKAILAAALERRVSHGAHVRSDAGCAA